MSLRSELANNLSELEKLNHSDKFILRPIISRCGAEKMNTCTHLHTKIARYNLSVTAAAGAHLSGFFLSFFFPLFFSLLPSRPLWACFPTPCPLRLIRTARNNTRGEEEGMSKTQQGEKKGSSIWMQWAQKSNDYVESSICKGENIRKSRFN